MSAIVWLVLALVFVLLDVAACVAFVLGLLTFVTLDSLKPLRWYFIVGGFAGALVLLPVADYFIGNAIKAVTGA